MKGRTTALDHARQAREQVTLGVDMHAELPVAAALDERGRLVGTCTIPTTTAGYAGLVRWTGQYGDLAQVGIEGTGSYSAGAIAGFEAAQRAAERLHARPWSIAARLRLAEALLHRHAPGDVDTARRILDEVEREAGEIGMHSVLRRLSNISVPDAVGENIFRPEGETWRVTFGGRRVAVPHAKGMQDLHILLSRPRIDMSVGVLIDPNGGAERLRPASSNAVIDEQAKAAYRQRLHSLEAAIEEALAGGDDTRAQALESERDSLIAELRRAAGLAGRTRAFTNESERARKTVTARIRDTLRHLDHRHPELASHLRQSVITGGTCRYQPAEDVDWILR